MLKGQPQSAHRVDFHMRRHATIRYVCLEPENEDSQLGTVTPCGCHFLLTTRDKALLYYAPANVETVCSRA
jgi:hypothetical protein